MNPFLLRGPQFLLFYLFFTAAVLLVLWRVRRWIEARRAGGHLAMTDPYLIAYLRGGRNEAIRVAVLGLIERGLLEVRNKIELVAQAPGRIAPGTDLLEAEVLRFFAIRKQAPDAFKQNSAAWESVLSARREALEKAGLVPGAEVRRVRWQLAMAGGGVLLGVSALKIALALSQGRSNIWFLVGLSAAAAIAAITVVFLGRRTPQGDTALEDVQSIFAGVKQRVHLRPSLDDLIMVAAVYGAMALPATSMAYMTDLYPRATAASGDSGSSGCGSSCGSSCGGGGGCGGGGCGGCGS
ncbi:MAG: TIGR04222 domain-containing membrane protein [Bryobacterales bacterium]|nr:TIGR04222 domain-containing membrane protein [Bryobacterales bacterium]